MGTLSRARPRERNRLAAFGFQVVACPVVGEVRGLNATVTGLELGIRAVGAHDDIVYPDPNAHADGSVRDQAAGLNGVGNRVGVARHGIRRRLSQDLDLDESSLLLRLDCPRAAQCGGDQQHANRVHRTRPARTSPPD